MRLDYFPRTGAFTLHLPRGGPLTPAILMEEHGFSFSTPMSTPAEACLFTKEPYAAAGFYQYATEAAKAELLTIQSDIDASWRQDTGAHIKVPPDKELWGFQKAGVEYALRRNNTLIGDQPGLGKTAQAIAFCNEIGAKRVLVLVPANIRLQWIKNIREWSTMDYPFICYPILHGRHGVHPTANWTVVSYDLARTAAIWKALAKGLYDCIILDEGHYLKTIDALRTRTVFGGGLDPLAESLASRAGSILSLTGTPLPNRPREAYTMARGLCWDSIDFMSEDRFRDRFNPSMQKETPEGKVYIDERSGRHGELQARLRSNFMVRRMKRAVMPQLKMPLLDIVHVEETKAVKQALAAESMLDIDPENLEGADAPVLGQVAAVRRMMGLAIAPLAVEYIRMVLDGGEDKVTVFAWHIDVLNILEKGLAQYGTLRIDGSVLPGRKQKLVDQFVSDPRKRVIMGNMQSMGMGTDGLQQVCTHAIFAEPDWVDGTNQQAIDRLDRGGQTGSVLAEFLVARNSFSERVLATALRKGKTTHKALDARFMEDEW